MRSLEQTRKYECLVVGEWVSVHWEQLEKGDVVRSCASTTLDGQPTEEYVVNQLPALKVDVVTGQGLTPLEEYNFTGVCDISYVAEVHGTTVQFIKRVNPQVTNWDRRTLRGIIRVPVPLSQRNRSGSTIE